MEKKVLIITNGEIPSSKVVKGLIKQSNLIICADGGADAAKRLKIRPDIIIGDFDSVTDETLNYYKNVKKIIEKNQNSTDLEKAINYCVRKKIKDVVIIGASGKRTDHTIGNLGCFKKFKKYINIRMYDANGELIGVKKVIRLNTKKGEIISLIPLNRCSGVTTKNLKYKLNNESLEIGVREGTHNIATGDYIEVSVKKGDMLIYRLYEHD